MARIRSVHPGQWTDVKFVSCSPLARLLAIALRNEADDRGVFVWEPLQLKMRVLPADNVDVTSLLDELQTHNQVRKFADRSGKEYGVIRNFRRWQRPDKPKVVYQLPTEFEDYVGYSPKDRDRGGGGSGAVDDRSGNSSPEGAEGGSRRRDSESKNGPEAASSLVSTHNKSSLQNQVSARNQEVSQASLSSASGLEGQSSESNSADKSKINHPLLETLQRKGSNLKAVQ